MCVILINTADLLCVTDLCELGRLQNHDKEPWGFQKGTEENSYNC